MKTTFLALAAALVLIAASPSSHDGALRPAAPINAVVGDASWLAAFGRAPDARVPDDVRITTHLTWVLGRLRAAPVGHLDAAGRAARARNLDRLARYIREGQFPRNPSTVHVRTPNFIDDDGRICAVGALLRADLGAGAVAAIRERFQFARIGAMTSAVLAAWQHSSGLSLRELAMIQPQYCPGGEPGCVGSQLPPPVLGADGSAVELSASVVNLGLAGVNALALSSGRPSRVLAAIGIGTGIAAGFVAARHRADRPLFTATTGFLSGVAGLAALRHRDGPRAPASAVSLSVGPTALGASAVAVHLRF